VPYPHATGDHQRANARAYARNGAAELVEDAALDGPGLEGRLRRLMDDPKALKAMAQSAAKLAKPQAALAVADVLEKLCSTN